MSIQIDEYFRGVNKINKRLDKLIELLILKTSIDQARLELARGDYVPYPLVGCTCHRKGRTSAVEVCPIHG